MKGQCYEQQQRSLSKKMQKLILEDASFLTNYAAREGSDNIPFDLIAKIYEGIIVVGEKVAGRDDYEERLERHNRAIRSTKRLFEALTPELRHHYEGLLERSAEDKFMPGGQSYRRKTCVSGLLSEKGKKEPKPPSQSKCKELISGGTPWRGKYVKAKN